MKREKIIYLLNGWVNKRLTDAELQEWSDLLKDETARDELLTAGMEVFDENSEIPEFQERLLPYLKRAMLVDRDEEEERHPASRQFFQHGGWKTKTKIIRTYLGYAAAALVVLAAGIYYYTTRPSSNDHKLFTQTETTTAPAEDILPGADRAILTLSDGRQVVLDSDGMQAISDSGLTIRNQDGMLSYGHSDLVVFNTMSTPRGGQYKLSLPDGTKVWLNAASSITYPTAFTNNERKVSITGEAYFEVTHAPEKPFKVVTHSEELVVLGTSFNVNSYTDETGIKTSLFSGSLRVHNMLLRPGEAHLNGTVKPTDLQQDLAWKNGVFNFDNTPLPDAMRQLARWYNVDLQYEGNTKNISLGGEIGRNLTLQQVLGGLQDIDLRFQLEGRTLIVKVK